MWFCNCADLKNLSINVIRNKEICNRCLHYCFWQDNEPGRTKPKRKRVVKGPYNRRKAGEKV